ncbi:MAG: cupin domain-containing protein [Methylomonas sp.]|jgi:mannose-6-phosphate isomerase-like protein (cupin superfamily)|uniref:cupin domain-containing protein n=1 Tax=Methylomonas sp. TaxID=418 RepID=UPI0025D406C9|nr:cupin domain-containing protein [Methylomonas sp.]MCK9605872.1 cupin domain-containing protein [Methylomonas sp.]
MDSRFNKIFTDPENSIFKVVFFPDRIYHAQYLNATRSLRYRYNVQEVRTKADTTIMKGEVYMDGLFYSNFMRIEYRAGRLVETARENNRFLRDQLLAFVRLLPNDAGLNAEAMVKLHYCQWVDAYQAEIWQTLEPPENNHHDFQVLDLMGRNKDITRIQAFTPALDDIKGLRRIEIAFRENDKDLPFGFTIDNPAWDNNYLRSHQQPNESTPSSDANTVSDLSYLIDFQRGWFLQADDVAPVRYRNALMEENNPDRADDNIVEMRWILQRELGGSLVFFHEVTIPPGKTEGTHRHIGSEELYYIVSGEGTAYMGEDDDPAIANLPTVQRAIYGLDMHNCKEIKVKPGSVIFTKSGGIHGIRNQGNKPLKFVAFLYQSS